MSPQRTGADPNTEWEYPSRESCQTPSQVSSHVEGSLDDVQADASLMPDEDMMPQGRTEHMHTSRGAVLEHALRQGTTERSHYTHGPIPLPAYPQHNPQTVSNPPRVAHAPFSPDVYFDILARSNGDLQKAADWLLELGAPLGMRALEQLQEAVTLGHWERLEVFNTVMQEATAPCPNYPQDARLITDQEEAAYEEDEYNAEHGADYGRPPYTDRHLQGHVHHQLVEGAGLYHQEQNNRQLRSQHVDALPNQQDWEQGMGGASLLEGQPRALEAAYLQPATPPIGEDGQVERRTGAGALDTPGSTLQVVDAASRGAGGRQGGAGRAVDVEAVARGAGAPSQFFCSICAELMRDPVIVATGQTYERKAIANWVKNCEQGLKPVTCPVTRQELKKPIMMFPNYALRNSIEEWAGEHASRILGPDGHVIKSEPDPEVDPAPVRPTHHPTGTMAVVGNPLRAQAGQDSHNPGMRAEGGARQLRNPNSWLNTGLMVGETFVPLCCILLTSLQCLVWLAGMENGGWALDSRHNNPLFGPTATRLRDMGAACTACVQDEGEWWRLVSAGFLFAGWWHLAFSVFGSIAIGQALEERYGFMTVLGIFLTSSILGSICSHLFVPQQVSVAGSAALFGLLGAFLADVVSFRQSRESVGARMFIVLAVFAFVNLIAGLMPYADTFAHIGGLVGGFLSGILAMAPSQTADMPPRHCKLWPEVQLLAGVSIIGLALGGSCMIQWSLGSDNWCEVCSDISCIPTSLWDCQSYFYDTSRVTTPSPMA